MPNLGISLAVGRSATSSGRPGGGATPFANEFSLDFDGTDEYLDCGDDSSLEPANVTISAWVKTTGSIGTFNYILSKLGAYYGTFHLRYTSANKFGFFIGLGAFGANVGGLSSSTYTLTDWNHVVLTYDKVNLKLYVNGSEDFSQAETRDILYLDVTSPYPGKDLTIGKGPFPDPAQGLIDEVSYFGSALSASDIAAIYNSGTPADLTSYSPVGWWRMGDNDGGTGTTITDQGSGENDGTLTNGPTFSPAVPPGYSNKAVDFDGANNQCNIDLTGLSGATKATFSLWYNKDTSTSYANAFGAGTLSPNLNFVGLDIGSTAIRFYCYQTDSPVSTTTLTASIAQDLGAWHHVVAVYDASITNKLTLYYDGSSVATGTSGPTSLNAYSVANGAIGVFLANSWFPGLLDEAAVWDSALSASDVTAIYNSGVPADLTSLSPTGWWRMGDGTEDGSGTTIYDMSSNSNNGTLVNGPTYSTDTP